MNSDMSTTSDPIPGPEASIGLCDVEYDDHNVGLRWALLHYCRCASPFSLWIRSFNVILDFSSACTLAPAKAKSTVIFDLDEETDDHCDLPAADPSGSDDGHARCLKCLGN